MDLQRKVTTPARAPDGLCVEPDELGPDREIYENHQRLRAANELDYADKYTGNPRTVDYQGRYNCGRCNKEQDEKCLQIYVGDPGGPRVALKINADAGSCRYWENQCAGDPEAWMLYSSIELAAYGIAANGVGWSCARCPKAVAAEAPDSVGRELYCREIDARVFPTACCAVNGAEVVPMTAQGKAKRADEDVQRLVRERVGLVRKVEAVLGPAFRGDALTDREILAAGIRQLAPAEPMGPEVSDDYLRRRFDALVDDRTNGVLSLGRAMTAR